MTFSVMTLFPEMISSAVGQSITGRAIQNGIITVNCYNIRDYSKDKHKRVDDYPYGGGPGMVMQCQPVYDCFCDIVKGKPVRPHTIYMSPKGKVLTQSRALELSKLDELIILCGHYEGVDQRVLDEIVDEQISIGDYVLTGGELAACVLIDCVARMVDGVLSGPDAFENESHFNGLLEHPQYTRPEVWHNKSVPQVLIGGNHKLINEWKRKESIEQTLKNRPDLLKKQQG